MESGNEGEGRPDQVSSEELYQVNLRPHMAEYFKTGLMDVHNRELLEIQRDGSYQKLVEFNNSSLSRLVRKLTAAPVDLDNPNSRVPLTLSQEDLSIMTNRTEPTSHDDYAALRAHGEMSDQLKANFNSAKMSARINKGIQKVRTFFKRAK